jgi:hypothetical protein
MQIFGDLLRVFTANISISDHGMLSLLGILTTSQLCTSTNVPMNLRALYPTIARE